MSDNYSSMAQPGAGKNGPWGALAESNRTGRIEDQPSAREPDPYRDEAAIAPFDFVANGRAFLNLIVRGAVLLLVTLLFLPLSLVLWGLGVALERIVGQSPTKVRASLARHELEKILRESQEVGLLQVAQRDLAQNLFANAARAVSELALPFHRIPHLKRGESRAQALKRAQRDNVKAFAVTDTGSREPIGYVRTIDLWLSEASRIETFEELPKIAARELHGDALIQMNSERWAMALVVDDTGRGIGLVTFDSLIDPLLAGPLITLRR